MVLSEFDPRKKEPDSKSIYRCVSAERRVEWGGIVRGAVRNGFGGCRKRQTELQRAARRSLSTFSTQSSTAGMKNRIFSK